MAMSRKANGALGAKPVARISESRKVRKPLMEKKRRARINQSLNDLKRLLLESNSVKKEGTRPTKLEKADILELTVTHVQKLHQQQQWGMTEIQSSDEAESSSKFKAGFSECARLVRELLQAQCRKIEPGLEQRLADHLDRCLTNLDQVLIDRMQQKSPSNQRINHQHTYVNSSSSRSPSPVSSYNGNGIYNPRSDSRSSFEGKDTVLLSPTSPPSMTLNPPFSQIKAPPSPGLSVPSGALAPVNGMLNSGLNGATAATGNGLIGGNGSAGFALSRTGQRHLWGAASTNSNLKSAFVPQPQPGWQGTLTQADSSGQCLTSCPVNANSSGDLLLGRAKRVTVSRIVSPECGPVGVVPASSPSAIHATGIRETNGSQPGCTSSPLIARRPPLSACLPTSDEDDCGNSVSSSQPSSPVLALDLRAQMGHTEFPNHPNSSSQWQRQVALTAPPSNELHWTHVSRTSCNDPASSSLTTVAAQLSLIRQQPQQLTCSSKISQEDSRVWRPW